MLLVICDVFYLVKMRLLVVVGDGWARVGGSGPPTDPRVGVVCPSICRMWCPLGNRMQRPCQVAIPLVSGDDGHGMGSQCQGWELGTWEGPRIKGEGHGLRVLCRHCYCSCDNEHLCNKCLEFESFYKYFPFFLRTHFFILLPFFLWTHFLAQGGCHLNIMTIYVYIHYF